MLFTLECDDGNNIDGDGCSHDCISEIYDQSLNGSKGRSSNFGNISLIVVSINRVG